MRPPYLKSSREAEALKWILQATVDRAKKLDLRGLHLTTLPPELGQCTALQTLYLDNNQLMSLPPELGQCAALQQLYLENNRLTTLPPELCQCTALQILKLMHNRLTTLPPELRQITRLKEIFLHGNPRLTLPEDILGPSWEDVYQRQATPKPPRDILAYYFRTRRAAQP